MARVRMCPNRNAGETVFEISRESMEKDCEAAKGTRSDRVKCLAC